MKHKWRSRKIKKSYNNTSRKTKSRREHKKRNYKGGDDKSNENIDMQPTEVSPQVNDDQNKIVRVLPLTPQNLNLKPKGYENLIFLSLSSDIFTKPTRKQLVKMTKTPRGSVIIDGINNNQPMILQQKQLTLGGLRANNTPYYITTSNNDKTTYYLFKPTPINDVIYDVNLNEAFKLSKIESLKQSAINAKTSIVNAKDTVLAAPDALRNKVNTTIDNVRTNTQKMVDAKVKSMQNFVKGISEPYTDKDINNLIELLNPYMTQTQTIYDIVDPTVRSSLIKSIKNIRSLNTNPPNSNNIPLDKIIDFFINGSTEPDISDVTPFLNSLYEYQSLHEPQQSGGGVSTEELYNSPGFIQSYPPAFEDDKQRMLTFLYYFKQLNTQDDVYSNILEEYKRANGPFTDTSVYKNTHLLYYIKQDELSCWVFYDITDTQMIVSKIYINDSLQPSKEYINKLVDKINTKIMESKPSVGNVKIASEAIMYFKENIKFMNIFGQLFDVGSDGYATYALISMIPKQQQQQPAEIQQPANIQQPAIIQEQQQPEMQQPEIIQPQQNLSPMKEDLKKPISDLIESLKKLLSN